MISNLKGIYAISDCVNLTSEDLLSRTEDILRVGISLYQYRNKDSDKDKNLDLALKLQSLCKKYPTPFIINDDLHLAKKISADGIHLGQHDVKLKTARESLGSKIIGVSCYNDLSRAISAEEQGADYVAFGSVFTSVTKPDANKVSIELLQEAKKILTIPIVAIGGITPENGKQLVDVNVDYLAVISGLYAAENIVNTANSYKLLFEQN
jgi:thiamine-phosphate pyrophosphorylase